MPNEPSYLTKEMLIPLLTPFLDKFGSRMKALEAGQQAILSQMGQQSPNPQQQPEATLNQSPDSSSGNSDWANTHPDGPCENDNCQPCYGAHQKFYQGAYSAGQESLAEQMGTWIKAARGADFHQEVLLAIQRGQQLLEVIHVDDGQAA